jgi:hypothetical protein
MFILHEDGAIPTLVPPNTKIWSIFKNLNVLFSTVEAVGQAWPDVQVRKYGV